MRVDVSFTQLRRLVNLTKSCYEILGSICRHELAFNRPRACWENDSLLADLSIRNRVRNKLGSNLFSIHCALKEQKSRKDWHKRSVVSWATVPLPKVLRFPLLRRYVYPPDACSCGEARLRDDDGSKSNVITVMKSL